MKIPFFSWLFLLPICTLFVSFGTFVVSGQCLDDQRDLLIKMKNSLIFDNASSTKLVRWKESEDCCSWEGVTCSDVGRVVGVNLDSESISGGLHNSSSLFRLQYLQSLSLAYNDFDISQIPTELGKLTNLNLATLVQNLSELEELYLDGVNISAQGNEWCQALSSSLPNLRVLSMSDCYLSGPLHSSLQKLQSLSIIHLDFNDLSALVLDFFADFTNLTSLCLYFCGLNGKFPKQIFQVPTLQTLDLSYNELLQGSLPEFHPNGSLQSLKLSYTDFSGSLPNSIGNLKRLSIIALSGCNFSGSIPDSMANLTQLVSLDISSNSFTGPIPSFNMAKNLTRIYLYDNSFTGQITFIHWEELQSLVSLDLSSNLLVGSIPTSLFSLPLLQELDLFNNRFSGQIHEFSNVSSFQLYTLDLSNNYLEGPIPMSLFELRGLEDLVLSSNNFSGSLHPNAIQHSVIPASYISNTTFLSLSSNKFHGHIPESICNTASLRYLDLSNNSLSGTIPQCLFPMSSILVLKLNRNNLIGKISDTFPADCSLIALNLNGNLLEGVVPKSLSNCTSLEVLDIGNNQIQDAFPCYLKNISTLRILILRSNKFYGSVGCGRQNVTWPMLQIVDLASNNFSDAITVTNKGLYTELGKIWDHFTSIDLSCNNLDGPIPEDIGVLKLLYILNLSHNAFTDRIPPSLGKLSQLESLDLSSNKLTGEIPIQLADGLIFLSVLNLSFNQLVGRIPFIKQFATFSEASYEGNRGLYGCPLKKECTSAEPRSPPPNI
uniref:Leucine-rich repeat-containing N-terminal plant-type domain-containing protein n=1 Tax=Fagus sylvatica TaxID=28930 RepID=A0A2N9HDV1_FAGSY